MIVLFPQTFKEIWFKNSLGRQIFFPSGAKKNSFASLADRNSIFRQSNCPLENNQIPRSQGSSPAVQSMVFPGYHLTLHSTLCKWRLGNWCKMLILLLLWEIASFLTQDKNLFVLPASMKPLSWLVSLQVGKKISEYSQLLTTYVFFNTILKILKLNFLVIIAELSWTTYFLLIKLMELIKRISNLLKK